MPNALIQSGWLTVQYGTGEHELFQEVDLVFDFLYERLSQKASKMERVPLKTDDSMLEIEREADFLCELLALAITAFPDEGFDTVVLVGLLKICEQMSAFPTEAQPLMELVAHMSFYRLNVPGRLGQIMRLVHDALQSQHVQTIDTLFQMARIEAMAAARDMSPNYFVEGLIQDNERVWMHILALTELFGNLTPSTEAPMTLSLLGWRHSMVSSMDLPFFLVWMNQLGLLPVGPSGLVWIQTVALEEEANDSNDEVEDDDENGEEGEA